MRHHYPGPAVVLNLVAPYLITLPLRHVHMLRYCHIHLLAVAVRWVLLLSLPHQPRYKHALRRTLELLGNAGNVHLGGSERAVDYYRNSCTASELVGRAAVQTYKALMLE